jgi:hypothetical protein
MEPSKDNIRPETYFLQRAVDRGLAAIAARLDEADGFRPFFWVNLSPEPGMGHDIWDLGDMCSRYTDAFILGRQMTGNAGFQEQEQALRRLYKKCDPYLHPFMATRMLLTAVDLYLENLSQKTQGWVKNLVGIIRSKMTFESDYAFYFKPPAGWSSLTQPFGNFLPYPTYPIGGIILALARYLEAVPDAECEDLLDRLCRFVLNESGTFTPDGRYFGHSHSGGILTAAAGIMRWAIRKDNRGVIEQMTHVLDWTIVFSSSWGWVPDGVGEVHGSCETCSITDYLHLALLAARYVDKSYYEVVERAARNQFLENQFHDPDRALPAGDFLQRDRVSKALNGSWASWSMPNSLDSCLTKVEGCCLGAGIRACFLVWEHIVEQEGDLVRVNMALSRNSPWAEVISYLPFEGRIEIRIHRVKKLQVRLPVWITPEQVKATINGKTATVVHLAGYAEFENLEPADQVQLEFPVPETITEERVGGVNYRVRWRGNTVTGIDPKGRKYPLYEREWMRKDKSSVVFGTPYQEQQGGPVHW